MVKDILVDKQVSRIRRSWKLLAATVVSHNQDVMWGRVRPELDGLEWPEYGVQIAIIKAQIEAAGAPNSDYYYKAKEKLENLE